MIRFLADEDFDNRILRGLLRSQESLDIIRVQDTHLGGAYDTVILAWASQHERVLLAHDVSTMTRYAYERMQAGQSVAGIIEVQQRLPIGKAIEDILLLSTCSDTSEWKNQILFLPL